MTTITLSNIKQQPYIMDEFGRDLTLRRSKATIEYDRVIKDMGNRLCFSQKSWAEIEQEEDEKEEQEEDKILKEKDMQRKRLWRAGLYELEEGEVFE
jgi:hypothetical protein